MNPLIILAVAWVLSSPMVALVIGRAIHLADLRSTCCPLHAGDDS